ncbi:hypothetical protein JIQ42_02398 [Leishmania sp. Namibia]|uniref:hypothetical protein n=1 Tax=Leishmania sp. Namibia TaxID=2802991 RepID=UPI001B4F8BA4|nr:hypothetical protein JIQ42_02398 [Leishmania sp. Namibia]
MWDFLSNVRESVRQIVAPLPSESSTASVAATFTPTTKSGRESGLEETVDQLTTGLFRLWRKVDETASKVLSEAFDGAAPLRDEAVPRLFSLTAEARASLPQDELLELLMDAVSQANSRTHQALDEANFLLSLGIEEQIAHTSDYGVCYDWWNRTVNRQLIACHDLLQSRFTNTSCTPRQLETVSALRAQMETMRNASTQPMAAVAARGRLLEDERYDLLASLPTMFPIAESVQTAHVGPRAPDSQSSEPEQHTPVPHSQTFHTHPQEGVATSQQEDPFYQPLLQSLPPSPAATKTLTVTPANTATLEECKIHLKIAEPPAAHESPSLTLHFAEEQARLQHEAEEQARLQHEAEEQARLQHEAEEQARLQHEAEEQARLQHEAEEQARLQHEAEEQARLQHEAEEQARMQHEAEEQARLQHEAEEQARLQHEAEEQARLQHEAEEQARLQHEAEEQARLQHEAEEQARLQHEAEEQARLQHEAEEQARLQHEAEEQARLQHEAEEQARLQHEAEEQARLQHEAEEQARLQHEAEEQARLQHEAEEQARLQHEAEEQARLQHEAEEQARLQHEAEEQARLQHEAEEQARLQHEAEEQARLQHEAEEQARMQHEAEEQARLQHEAEEQARLQHEAEEQARLQHEAEEQARMQHEAEEMAARAKVSRAAQEVFAELVGQLIMGGEIIQSDVKASKSSQSALLHRAATNDDDGWDDDEGFEEVNMDQFTAYLNSSQRRCSWGGVNASTSSSSLPSQAQAQTPACAQRDAATARKKRTPPTTPLPGARGVGETEMASTTTGRRAGGMSLRRKSPPVRMSPGGAAVMPAIQPRSSIGSVSGVNSPYRATVNATGGAGGFQPAQQQSLLSTPSTESTRARRQVHMEDDDKWDDDW